MSRLRERLGVSLKKPVQSKIGSWSKSPNQSFADASGGDVGAGKTSDDRGLFVKCRREIVIFNMAALPAIAKDNFA